MKKSILNGGNLGMYRQESGAEVFNLREKIVVGNRVALKNQPRKPGVRM